MSTQSKYGTKREEERTLAAITLTELKRKEANKTNERKIGGLTKEETGKNYSLIFSSAYIICIYLQCTRVAIV